MKQPGVPPPARGMASAAWLRPASRAALWCAAFALALPAEASFGNFHIDASGIFVIAAIAALPGALVLGLIELIGGRRRRPLWLGVVALGAAAYCAARLAGYGPRGDVGLFLLPIPPLATLALVCLVSDAKLRLVAVWCVALAGLWLAISVQGPGAATRGEAVALPAGGAVSSLLVWQFFWWLGRRAARNSSDVADPVMAVDASLPPAEALPESTAGMTHGIASSARAGAVAELPPRQPMHPGWIWFLAGAATVYVGVAILTAAGFDGLWWSLARVQWRVTELFALPSPIADPSPVRSWALHGVPWALLGGCVAWGWGAVAGMFDPGRLRVLRLAAALLPVIAFAVAGAMISVMPR